MALMARIGARIAEARKRKKLTQVELARRLEVSQNVVSGYERGTTNIPIDKLEKLVDILGMPIEFFVSPKYEYTVEASEPESPKKARRRREAAHEPALR